LADRPRFADRVFRKDLIPLLLANPMSVSQIARLVGEAPRDIEADVQHLLKSLKHTGFIAHIEPARCRKCGFEFDAGKLARPSKCPQCKGTWILEPRIRLNESP
jgi:predicted Zn-ribbon and HTH transcriptional regulator